MGDSFQFPIGRDMHGAEGGHMIQFISGNIFVSIPYRERYAPCEVGRSTAYYGFQFPIGRDMHYCKNTALQTYSTV